MKFWFDTEFIEDGRTIDLISIGVVGEDGRQYYAECEECDLTKASTWIIENVIPKLKGRAKPRTVIARELIEFMGESPEIWAYYADYDWVALCQLFGTMMDLPPTWPKYCRDVKQLGDSMGNPEQRDEHNALADAIWCAEAWKLLEALQRKWTCKVCGAKCYEVTA